MTRAQPTHSMGAVVRPRPIPAFAAGALLSLLPACSPPCTGDDCGEQGSASDGRGSTGGTSDSSTSPSSADGLGTADGSAGDTTADDATTAETETDTAGNPDQEDFEPGALIIPMDTDHQDMGMLMAYGLVYRLLSADIPVRWAIREGKAHGEIDFEATCVDIASGADVGTHGYRGGPWVIAEADANAALPIVMEWQDEHPETTVHQAAEPFTADIGRRLIHAPTIAIFADTNEDIARDYLMAAGIPDSQGDPSWPDESPDLLSAEEIAGPTDTDHEDGALFGPEGAPRYCQLMSMHWGVGDAEANPEVVAEVGQYLTHDVHFFAECQAVSAFENIGHFLTPNGFEFADQADDHDLYRADSPFGQIDGAFESVGGSEPAYSLPPGDSYFVSDTVIISTAGTPEGQGDVWMTGFLHGLCPPDDHVCNGAGKVSYLGGHRYDLNLPISDNPTTQGVRLFLNSLFEAPCALDE